MSNHIIVEILKFEWDSSWKNFLPDLCSASRTNQYICENSMKILKMLSQEIFDFSKNCMTSEQIQQLKYQMTNEFQQVYELCYFVLTGYLSNSNAVKQSLIKATLEALLAFLSWIPIGYIYMTDLIDVLLMFVDQAIFRIGAIRCL